MNDKNTRGHDLSNANACNVGMLADKYLRTVKGLQLFDCILSGGYNEFMLRYADAVKNVKMETFWHMQYFINSKLRSPAEHEAMRIFIAKKNNMSDESFFTILGLDEKKKASLKEAMQIDFNFHEFIDKKCPLENLEALMSYNISAVDFYSVYALVEDALPGKSIALSEQSFKEFSWAVDTISAMLHKLCTPKQAFDYFYEGLKDLRRDVA